MKTLFPTQKTASRQSLAFLSLLGMLSACVTVNVNFPESAVQKAADDYVRELYRAKEKKSSTPSSWLEPAKQTQMALMLWEWLTPSASAAEVNAEIKFDSPSIKAIQTQQAGLISELKNQKRAGYVGETKDGYVALREADKLPPPIKSKLEKLVKQENDYRDNLYNTIHSEQKLQKEGVKRTFTRAYQGESPSGTWVEDSGGNWERKP